MSSLDSSSLAPYADSHMQIGKKFVFPPFHATTAGDENTTWANTNRSTTPPMEELDFTDDPADALLILLRIAHFQFTTIPTSRPLNALSVVAIVCDQYDCIFLVQP